MAGVDLRVGARATADLLAAAGGDTVVLATGALAGDAGEESVDGWPSRPLVRRLSGRRPVVGERVVVVGHGEGAEFAVSLARQGHQVWLVEQGIEPRPAVYDYAGRMQALRDYLAEAGVTIVGLAEAAKVADGEVQVRYRHGRTSALPADTVLVAGRQAGESYVGELAPAGWDVYPVGDCVGPLGVAEALQAARLLVDRLSR